MSLFAGMASAQTIESWWIGTGGCDGAMVDCTDDKKSEQVLSLIHITADGKMSPHHGAWVTDGLPVWVASIDRCSFAALADKSVIVSADRFGFGATTATGGAAPVHMTATANDKYLLVANYHGPDDATTSDGAGVSSLAIAQDCSLKQVDFVPHAGSGPDKDRQGGAHVHSVYASRDGQLAYVCDLGQDLIFTYSVSEDGKLTEVNRASTAPGAGPRHLAEHPSLDFVYSVQEMEMTVAVWHKGADGKLGLRQMMSLVPEGSSRKGSKAGEIVIARDGSALYASNRGELNTVTVFSVAADGSIAQTQQIDAPRFPRGMELAHGGSLLLVASQQDTTLESFKVAADGTLTPTGNVLSEGLPNHPATLGSYGPREDSVSV